MPAGRSPHPAGGAVFRRRSKLGGIYTGSYQTGLFPKARLANWLRNRPQKYVSVVALRRDVSPGKHQKCNRFGFGGIKRPF